jgi:acetyl esterase/lipase
MSEADPTPSMEAPVHLDPHWAALLAESDPSRAPTVEELRVELRRLTERLPRVAVGPVDDVTVVGAHGPTNCRIYRPVASAGSGALAVYFHGGGWVAGDLDTHDPLCRQIVHHGDVTLIAVDYPLAPEFPFPAPVDAALDVYRWACASLGALGHGPTTAVALVGDSAGANLAAALTWLLTTSNLDDPQPSGLVVTHPVMQPGNETQSHARYGTGFGLTSTRIQRCWEHYAPDPHHRRQPAASPLLAESFVGFPATWVQTAQYDPARSDGERFVERLRADGVTTRHTCYYGQIHGFQTAFDRVPAAADSLRAIAVALREIAGA